MTSERATRAPRVPSRLIPVDWLTESMYATKGDRDDDRKGKCAAAGDRALVAPPVLAQVSPPLVNASVPSSDLSR